MSRHTSARRPLSVWSAASSFSPRVPIQKILGAMAAAVGDCVLVWEWWDPLAENRLPHVPHVARVIGMPANSAQVELAFFYRWAAFHAVCAPHLGAHRPRQPPSAEATPRRTLSGAGAPLPAASRWPPLTAAHARRRLTSPARPGWCPGAASSAAAPCCLSRTMRRAASRGCPSRTHLCATSDMTAAGIFVFRARAGTNTGPGSGRP